MLTFALTSPFNYVYFINKKQYTYFIYLYTSIYFFLLPGADQHNLLYAYPFVTIISRGLFLNKNFKYNCFIYFFCFLNLLKFSFSGKGYKITSNQKNTVTFHFGHSHLWYIYNYTNKVIFTTKTRGFLLGLNAFLIKQNLLNLYYTRPINIYSRQGFRLTKQLIKRKTGKISLYL